MSLRRAVDQAGTSLARAARDRSLNAFAQVTLPGSFDPRVLLNSPTAAGVVGSYERPDDGFALIGIGEAARIDLAVGEQPTAARRRARELFEGATRAGAHWLRPRLLGGFRFAPDQSPTVPWERFGAGSLVLPRMLFVLEDGEVGVVLAPGVPASEAAHLIERTAGGDLSAGAEPTRVTLRQSRSVDEEAWLGSVAAIAEEIRAGVYEKTVLATSVELTAEDDLPLGPTLAQLRADYPDCRVVSFTAGDATLVCASPELLIHLEGGRARTLGLASSQRRGRNAAEDRVLANELLADPKSRGEHEVVVREIVERMADATDRLEVDDEPSVWRFRNIQHLATNISGDVKPEFDVLDLVERLHPTPAVCGRPRVIARGVIAQHESFDRGWYAGPVGWLDANGDGEFAVALRTALLRGPRAWLFAGNGIMGDSDPQAELDEVSLKFRPLAEALGGRAPSESSAIPA